jgi:putative transposase
MCTVLGVSSQAFYGYLKAPKTKRQQAAETLDAVVVDVFHKHRGRYGSRRVQAVLKQEHSMDIGIRRIEESLVRQGLFATAPKKFVVTTQADEAYEHPANELARDFTATRPNERWVTDITYCSTFEGWLYLAAIIDLYSRKIVGWSIGPDLDTSLPMRALQMALAQRDSSMPLLHHSDRGCQYTSDLYTKALKKSDITISMSRRGNCWDNAVAESFFATIKKELVHCQDWTTRAELEAAIFQYVEVYYNRKRLHSSLGYRSPLQAEQEFLINRQAA